MSRQPDDGAFGRSTAAASARTIVLVLVAVAIGVFLLRDMGGTASSDSVSAASSVDDDKIDNGDDEGDAAETTTTTVPVDPSKVTVLVANGSTVKGAAGRIAEQLKAANYVTAPATNTKTPVNASVVYYRTGYEAAAKAVASLLKPTPTTAALPEPSPVADLGGAHVLVVIAADLAPKA